MAILNYSKYEIRLYSSGSIYSTFLKRLVRKNTPQGPVTADFAFSSNLDVLKRIKKRLEHLFASYTFPVKVYIDKPPLNTPILPGESQSILGRGHFEQGASDVKTLSIVANQDSGLIDFQKSVCRNNPSSGVVVKHFLPASNPASVLLASLAKCDGDMSDAELESAIYSLIGQYFGFNLANIAQSAKSPSIGGNLNLNSSGAPCAATKSFEKNAYINSKYFIHEQENINRLSSKLSNYSSETKSQTFMLTPIGGKKRVPYDFSVETKPIGESQNFEAWKDQINNDFFVPNSSTHVRTGLIQRSGDDDILLIPIRKLKEGGLLIKSLIEDEMFTGFFTLEIIHPSQLSIVGTGEQQHKYDTDQADFYIHTTRDESNVPSLWKTNTGQKYNFPELSGNDVFDKLNHSNLIAIRIKATAYKNSAGTEIPSVYSQSQNIGAYAIKIHTTETPKLLLDSYGPGVGIYLQSQYTTGSALMNPILDQNAIYMTMNGEEVKYIAMHNKKIESLDSYNSPPPDIRSRNIEGVIAVQGEDGKWKLYVAQFFKYSQEESLIEDPYEEQDNVFFSARKVAFQSMAYKVD